VDALVSLTDLAATFLDAAGVPRPADWDSRSILPLARDGDEGQPQRDAVFLERERHSNCRKGNLGYPVRGIRTREFLYLRNFHPDRWPAGDPEFYWNVGEYGDVDNTPSKRLLQAGEHDPQLSRFFQFVFGKRPSEELYDLAKDPGQVRNIAADPAYAGTLNLLRHRVTGWMEATGDPRAKSDTDFWDLAPYYYKKARQKED
jgi:arylsulfatase A-like enzyme